MSVERTQTMFDYVDRTGIRMMPFIRVPKYLLEDPFFQVLSVEAILLYSILLDRLELSLANDWFDEHGNDEYIRTAQFIGLVQYLSQFHMSSVTAVSRCSRQRSRSFSPRGMTSTAQLSVRRPSESSQLTIRSSWPISIPSGRLPRTAAR